MNNSCIFNIWSIDINRKIICIQKFRNKSLYYLFDAIKKKESNYDDPFTMPLVIEQIVIHILINNSFSVQLLQFYSLNPLCFGFSVRDLRGSRRPQETFDHDYLLFSMKWKKNLVCLPATHTRYVWRSSINRP